MLALVAPASAGSMKADTDTEIDDRPADMCAIYAIEDRAEAIAEGEKMGGVARVAARESAAKWRALRATLAQKGASVAALARMDFRRRELARTIHGSRDVKRAANDVTDALAPLFVTFGEAIPKDVRSLDYLGRSIGLDAAPQQSRAGSDAFALDRAWLHLKSRVTAQPRLLRAHQLAIDVLEALTDRVVALAATVLL